ncbi:hypothetical protein F8M41_001979 [Gigaspora margarita]|uniref:Uncharacterized protein n=1 Tax=Gigaspora margarita TaxID=4874 RepID=A0A8H4A7N9_GIGMA|nr:hypothetical protein F8M41_001979 [Gigaspora margarita]
MNDNLPKLGIKQLHEIQIRIDSIPLPVDIGRINLKIASEAEIEAGHTAMMAFLQYAEQIYGKNFCSPNMHLHKHLRECIIDYGPWYSFWCFAYERYNGELGSFSNSNHNMELEVLENFNRQIYIQQIKTKAYHYLPQNFLSSLNLITQANIEKLELWVTIILQFKKHWIFVQSPTSHYLAIVDWYRRDSQKQSYFHVKSRDKIFKNILSTNANGTYHAELWKDRFVEQGIATILPIQRIISQFVKRNGIKLPGSKKNISSLCH